LKPQIEANTNLNQLLAGLPQKSLSGPYESALKSESSFSLYNLIFGGLWFGDHELWDELWIWRVKKVNHEDGYNCNAVVKKYVLIVMNRIY